MSTLREQIEERIRLMLPSTSSIHSKFEEYIKLNTDYLEKLFKQQMLGIIGEEIDIKYTPGMSEGAAMAAYTFIVENRIKRQLRQKVEKL